MTITRLLKRLSALLLCVTFTQLAFSQTKVITGTVLDDKGLPVQGASVAANGSRSGTTTGINGTFKVTVSESTNSLTISSIAFTSQTIDITGKTEISVSLVSSNTNLSDVVVVGYGTVRKKDLTGSVVSVKAKDFNQGTITTPDQLLQNKVAGLEIVNNSGQPGVAATVKIRGNNSIRSGDGPLYVIDGVALDGRTAKPSLDLGANGLPFGATPESNPLIYINPNDIAQIDVLKDASATAIYGSRGANGIIIITTKKSSSGGTKLEFGTNFGIAAGYMKKYPLLSASQFRSESLKNNLKQDSGYSVDVLKEITQNTLSQNYNLAVSGGNESGKYRASFLGSSTQGFLKKTSLDKYLGNLGGQYKFLDKRLSIDFDVIAGHTTENMQLLTNTAGAGGNLLAWALNWNPTVRLKNNDGLWNNNTSNTFGVPNPLAVIDAYNDVADVDVFLANISAGLRITDHLDYKFLFAINHGTGTRKTSIDGWVNGIQGVSGSGFGAVSRAALTSQTFTHTLNYHASLTQSLKFEGVAGYEYWKTDYSNSTTSASGFNTNLSQSSRTSVLYSDFLINAQKTYPISQSIDPTSELQSYFARVNFDLSGKYYLTATVRDDGSNKFGVNNKYGVFPSVGAKWVVSNEDFLKNSGSLSDLSLRASWGITGNQEFPSGASQAQISSSAYNAAGQTNVFNPDLKWEKTTMLDFGLSYGFLNGRISGMVDYYHKNTTDLLFQSTAIQPAPSSIYFINLPANLINSGVEFSIGAGIIEQKDFSWDLNFNMAYDKNILRNFHQALIPTGRVDGNGVSGGLAQAITNNEPVDVYHLKPFQGYDHSGNQVVDSANKGPLFAGDPNPHLIMGFSTTLTYKKLSLSINAGGSFAYKIYNNTYNTITNVGQFSKGLNVAEAGLKTGESIGDGAQVSTRYLENGNYLKLRNLTITYAFGNLGSYIKNFNAFVSCSNLFVITKFTGFDPEVNIDKNRNSYPSRSMEYLPYPTPRVISFGFNLGL
ncbi:MAG: SusC/RagA family TonB-linked outer membrane protein [Chitinophagales bacterium]